MKRLTRAAILVFFAATMVDCAAMQARAEKDSPNPIRNADFESGDLSGWRADANWKLDDNSAGGWYNGWQGKWFAWSGFGGEQRTGKLESAPFILDNDAVQVWAAGWTYANVRGKDYKACNYVTLNLADGTELDRTYAPNRIVFTPLILDGRGHQGQSVYIEAVDDAKGSTYSMLCIDNVKTVALLLPDRLSEFDARKSIKIENEFYRVEVSRKNGAITRIRDKTGKLELIREPRLGDNFELSLPLPGKEAWMATEANYIYGREQPLSSFTQSTDTLTLCWKGPLENYLGEPYNASVMMKIKLTDRKVQFELEVDNSTDYEIGELYYPIIGGTLGLGKANDCKNTELILPFGTGIRTSRIYHTFQNFAWLGSLCPEQYYAYPDSMPMPWMELYSARLDRGVYFGAHDPIARFKVLQLEQLPGGAASREDGNWPRPEELNGLAAGVRLCYVHIAYHPPRETFKATPVILQFHNGGWKEAAKIYHDWFASQFNIQQPQDSWLRRYAAFQDCRSVPFEDLAQWAKDGLEYGVKALLLSGWKAGGHANGVPRFEPDQKLGTKEELAAALNECHQLGVKVFLLVNIQTVDPRTDWYNEELNEYVCKDRWGINHTAGGLRWVSLNPGSPGMRKMLTEQIKQLAELGADGVYFQNFFGRSLDFNPHLDTTPDQANWDGGLRCLDDILKACRAVKPDFCISIDTARDRLLQYTDVSRATMSSEQSAFKTAFKSWQSTMTVVRGNQYDVVNNALRYGAQLRIAPVNHTASMQHESMKELSAYIKEILRIREQLKDVLILGQYLGSEQILMEGQLPYSTFRNPKTGRRGCVLTNNTRNPVKASVTGFDEGRSGGAIVVYQPFEPLRKATLPVTFEVPASRAVVIAELP